MKYLLTTLALFTVIACNQKAKEDEAKSAITKYLSTAMNDFSSYQPVEFGKMDTLHQQFDESELGKKMNSDMDSLKTQRNKLKDEADQVKYDEPARAIPLLQEATRLTKEEGKILDSYIDSAGSYRGPIKGYGMLHSFRGKNAMGAFVMNRWYFTMDTAFKITDAKKRED
jgi:hypothetical protein